MRTEIFERDGKTFARIEVEVKNLEDKCLCVGDYVNYDGDVYIFNGYDFGECVILTDMEGTQGSFRWN